MVHQSVISRVQSQFRRVAAVLPAIDNLLVVLDAHADGKGFLFQDNAFVVQHVIRIAGAVPNA